MAIEKRIGAYSAYAIAVEQGFAGTKEEWLESLIGKTGAQGWSVKSAKISADGKLIFTIENPATGEIKDLPSLDINELDAIEAVEGAQTTALNAITEAKTQATEAVGTAENQALQDISAAKTSATGAVNTAGENAVNSVNSAASQIVKDAQTAINDTKGQAVSDVQNAGQSAVGAVEEAQTAGVQAVEDAQTNAVQSVQNAGTAEIEKINDILPVPTEADAGKVPVAKPDGSGYELGSQIDDTKTKLDTTWSSENIISRLCPPFTVEGAVVTCQPVEGSRLNTVVQIEPVQEGEGDPSPENVRQIKGWEAVKLTHNEKEVSIPLGQTVYGGTLDLTNGTLTVNDTTLVLDGLKNKVVAGSLATSEGYAYLCRVSNYAHIPDFARICSHYRQVPVSGSLSIRVPGVFVSTGIYGGGDIYLISDINNLEQMNAYLSAQNSAGTPVQVVYKLGELIIIQLTPQEILALSGVNTVYADAGDVTVSGHSDPTAIINSLADRIAALEQNAIGG